MKIDTSILRNELQVPIEVGDTTEDFNKGWHKCTEEVEEAIQRAEKKTMQTMNEDKVIKANGMLSQEEREKIAKMMCSGGIELIKQTDNFDYLQGYYQGIKDAIKLKEGDK